MLSPLVAPLRLYRVICGSFLCAPTSHVGTSGKGKSIIISLPTPPPHTPPSHHPRARFVLYCTRMLLPAMDNTQPPTHPYLHARLHVTHSRSPPQPHTPSSGSHAHTVTPQPTTHTLVWFTCTHCHTTWANTLGMMRRSLGQVKRRSTLHTATHGTIPACSMQSGTFTPFSAGTSKAFAHFPSIASSTIPPPVHVHGMGVQGCRHGGTRNSTSTSDHAGGTGLS